MQGEGLSHGFIPPAQGFPQPHIPEEFGAAGGIPVPSAGATAVPGTRLPPGMGKCVSGNMGGPEGRAHGSGTRGKANTPRSEPTLLCLGAPVVNNQHFTARDKMLE